MKTRVRLSAGAAILIAAGYASLNAPNPLPPPYRTPSASNWPQIIAKPSNADFNVPPRFHVTQYASGFARPRYMRNGPSGEVFLTDSLGKVGKVYVLVDKNKDFKAESKKVLLQNLDLPFGMVSWRSYLYVAERTRVRRYQYNRTTMTVGPGQTVINLPGISRGHGTRTLDFDKVGQKLYMAVGSGSDHDAGEPPIRGAISQWNPDGTGFRIFASGLRNPIGLTWEPLTRTLWATVQERDGLGDDLVPDFITRIRDGAFYGWPYAYIGPHEDPRHKGKRPDLVKKTIVPDMPVQAHLAVMDARFYTGAQFPSRYHGGMFVACHGSWNRSKRVGYNVIFLPFQNGRPTGVVEEFLSGFMFDPNIKNVWGRPVGLLQLWDGSLLLSDDGGNKVWRISYK